MKDTEKEIKDFLEKLAESEKEINNKIRFVSEHKFEKEKQYLSDKVSIIREIRFELQSVLKGNTKGSDAKFMF